MHTILQHYHHQHKQQQQYIDDSYFIAIDVKKKTKERSIVLLLLLSLSRVINIIMIFLSVSNTTTTMFLRHQQQQHSHRRYYRSNMLLLLLLSKQYSSTIRTIGRTTTTTTTTTTRRSNSIVLLPFLISTISDTTTTMAMMIVNRVFVDVVVGNIKYRYSSSSISNNNQWIRSSGSRSIRLFSSSTKTTTTTITGDNRSIGTTTTTTSSSRHVNYDTIQLHQSNYDDTSNTNRKSVTVVRIPEHIWRKEAREYQTKIYKLLQPGFVKENNTIMNSGHLRRNTNHTKHKHKDTTTLLQQQQDHQEQEQQQQFQWRALDPYNPIYNFLIEYYGIKGTKGVKRLARWSPGLLFIHHIVQQQQEQRTSIHNNNNNNDNNPNNDNNDIDDNITSDIFLSTNDSTSFDSCSINSNNYGIGGGVLLVGANEDDLSYLLHLRGASIENDGILYCSKTYFQAKYNDHTTTVTTEEGGSAVTKTNETTIMEDKDNNHERMIKVLAPYIWYRKVLQQTLNAEPVLYCYGLHEWAMQYQPLGAPIPPSTKYQQHIPYRVSQHVINTAVERVGTRCTHVDALRYFAPAAAKLNHHGSILYRMDQIRLEQPGCVHANMDLLKIVMKLDPFVASTLRYKVLDMAIQSRMIDIGASPYDVTTTYNVPTIPIETEEGRILYRQKQLELMKRVQPIRREVLQSYNTFLYTTFTSSLIDDAIQYNGDPNERYTQTTPGGLPWRKNTISP